MMQETWFDLWVEDLEEWQPTPVFTEEILGRGAWWATIRESKSRSGLDEYSRSR